MEGTAIIFIVIGAIIIWALFFRQINPSNKTDDQLFTLYRMAQPGSDELDLIHKEMVHRGILGDSSKTNINQEDVNSVAEFTKELEDSGMLEDLQEVLESELPLLMSNKIIEISRIKEIPEQDASMYFTELFEKLTIKYINSGLSQEEAEEKGIKEALATQISKD